jgi:hypothetical protein
MRQSPSIYNKTPNPEPEDSKSKGDSPMNKFFPKKTKISSYSVHNPLRNTAFNNIQSKNFIPTQENDIFTTSNSNGMGNTMRNFGVGGGSFKPMVFFFVANRIIFFPISLIFFSR